MKYRKHAMPFGTESLPDGGVRFRLWAPEAGHIDLLLDDSRLAMRKSDSGWFDLVTGKASTGSRYRFAVNGQTLAPDPASRFQPQDVHGPSEVIDPSSFEWTDADWRGRPWEETALYELHVGTFSAAGNFAGVAEKLDYLADLGVTAIELMPLSDFAGKRNWGYDGVLPFAPDSSYGRPDELKTLIQAAHGKGIMVLLDVVYNHFGPEGNYLHAYAPQFFTSRHCTPWGNAINFDGEHSRTVRDFFIHNALYWLEEFHFDGLRLDAVHAIRDDSRPDILTELAGAVRQTFGDDRHIHLVLENEDNASRYLRSAPRYDAQWNDDIHHVCHVLTSGEKDGYFSDYVDEPLLGLGKCLTEGFLFQGQASAFRGGKPRGEVSEGLPPTRFISFLQNHDQVGNRAFGERNLVYSDAKAIRAAMAILLLAPSPPLLFMGEEFGARTPFLFFCDFEPDLAKAVTEGRRAEFARFAQFRDPANRDSIPDPNAPSTFAASKLDWTSSLKPEHTEWLTFYSSLLALRQKAITPFLLETKDASLAATYSRFGTTGLSVEWKAGARALRLYANLGDAAVELTPPEGMLLFASFNDRFLSTMPAWSVAWYVNS